VALIELFYARIYLIAALLTLGVVAVGLLLDLLAAAIAVAVALLAAMTALRGWLQPWIGRWTLAKTLTFGGLTTNAVASVAPRPSFDVAIDGVPVDQGPAPSATSDSPAAAAFRVATEHVAATLPRPRPEPLMPVANVAKLAATVRERIDPWLTIPARVTSVIDVSAAASAVGVLRWDQARLGQIMAAPEFPQPMYEPLRDLSQDFLLPGVELVPHDTLGLLLESHAFIESYMVGLNHEMSRELLWNNYPTDQRGSYFRQFWDVRGYVREPGDPADDASLREKLKDIPSVHTWPLSAPLGQHRNRPGTDKLVLLVRGELLKRYPNAVIYAGSAKWDPVNRRHDLADAEKHPLYRGTLSPDITFFGFDLTLAEARGNTHDHNDPNQGWFFVFQQQPGEPRFGLEPDAPGVVHEWNDLSWANLAADQGALDALEQLPFTAALHGNVAINGSGDHPNDPSNGWGVDSAQSAYVLLRRPVRIAVHAETMLPH
jgi:hypothetical protein